MAEDWEVAFGRLEERMNTMQAKYETGLAHLSEQLAERDARLAEQRAARDARLLGGVLGIIGLGLVVLGFLIRLG